MYSAEADVLYLDKIFRLLYIYTYTLPQSQFLFSPTVRSKQGGMCCKY